MDQSLWRAAPLSAALFMASCATVDQGPAFDRTTIDTLAPALLEEHDVPAVGVAFFNEDGVFFAESYGEARPGVPVDENSMFNVASVTKMLASEAVLRLAGTGAFSLDEPMAPTWVDPDVADDPRHKMLTPRHALAHQTGFPNWRAQADDNKLAFGFEPGSRPGYSGEGYQYVARFTERVAGEAFPALVERTILDPAGVKRASFHDQTIYANDFTWSKGPDGSFEPVETWPYWSAADDLYVTPQAFGAIASELLAGETLPADLEADRQTIQFDMTAQFCGRDVFADICPEGVGFGLTGIVFAYENETVLWQGGGDVGERAVVFYVPAKNIGAVIFTNGSNGAKLFSPIAALVYDNADYIRFLELQGQQG